MRTWFDEFAGLNLTEDEKRNIRKMRDRVREFKKNKIEIIQQAAI